jgi:hypothetical protein
VPTSVDINPAYWASSSRAALVSGFGSGVYSAKLLNGTKHRFSGLSQARQCGDEVFRTLVTDFPNELLHPPLTPHSIGVLSHRRARRLKYHIIHR